MSRLEASLNLMMSCYPVTKFKEVSLFNHHENPDGH